MHYSESKRRWRVLTPCVRQCRLVNDKCTGCGRTKEELINWTKYTDNQRKEIMEKLNDNNV